MVSAITCHILDTTLGLPASNVSCELYFLNDGAEILLGNAQTDNDGRIKNWSLRSNDFEWINSVELKSGNYKVRFNTFEYFTKLNRDSFFPFVDIVFRLPETPDNHYHIPLLLSNYGYSTYRGS